MKYKVPYKGYGLFFIIYKRLNRLLWDMAEVAAICG